MSGDLSGKIALVTGASQGIGRSVALALAKQGATVVVNYNSNAAKADEVVQAIGADRSVAVQADVSDISASKRLVDTTVQKYGRIDILVLNAAVAIYNGGLDAITESDFDKLYATNVKAPLFLTQHARPHIPAGGRVLFFSTSLTNLSSITPNYLLYVSSKGAVEQMTRVLAKDLATKGVTVNAIAPGPTATELFYQGKDEPTLKRIASFAPMNRIGTPEEVADAAVMLCTEAGRWINGQILRVNGGMTVG